MPARDATCAEPCAWEASHPGFCACATHIKDQYAPPCTREHVESFPLVIEACAARGIGPLGATMLWSRGYRSAHRIREAPDEELTYTGSGRKRELPQDLARATQKDQQAKLRKRSPSGRTLQARIQGNGTRCIDYTTSPRRSPSRDRLAYGDSQHTQDQRHYLEHVVFDHVRVGGAPHPTNSGQDT